jgi:simple sugar transport system ATP-binding protein
MENISKSFSGKAANEDVSLTVEKGEIHALLGENGAGKTTLMNILYGIYRKDKGRMLWKGKDVNFQSPRDALANRIGMVHQHFMLVPSLTVSENVTLGIKTPGYPFTRRRELNESIRRLSEKYGLDINPEAEVRKLSVGEEQRVEIIKLLYRDAELLILDEPTAVLTPRETELFFDVLRRLKDEGHAVILITHRIPEVLAVTDRITILRDGRAVAGLKTSETDAQELSRIMIGRDLAPAGAKRDSSGFSDRSPGLELAALCSPGKGQLTLNDINLRLRAGEVLGVAGVDGNGQKELAECIAGLRKSSGGRVLVKGEDVTDLNASGRYKRGLAYISDDRHHDGLVLDMTLEENYILNGQLRERYSRKGFVQSRLRREAVEKAVDEFDIKTEGTDSPIGLLSGGNQQKLILARELHNDPDVVIAFQPTRGLDIGASEFTRNQLLRLRDRGSSILLISTDLEEIRMLSDRIGVMFEGRLSRVTENRQDLDLNRIGQLMAGHNFKEAEQ